MPNPLQRSATICRDERMGKTPHLLRGVASRALRKSSRVPARSNSARPSERLAHPRETLALVEPRRERLNHTDLRRDAVWKQDREKLVAVELASILLRRATRRSRSGC